MQLEFLGTGAGSPSKQRNVTSVALKLLEELNEIWLFDAGEATQHQILHTTIRPRKVTKIFITHLHGDHIFGLPGFLSSRSFQGGNEPLTIYGPVGIKKFVMTALQVSESRLSYPLKFVEIDHSQELFNERGFKVTTMSLDHKIACYGYRIEEADHPGELQVDKLRQDNIPSGPIYGQLKAGKTVKLDDGRVIDGKNYIGKPQPGRIIAILGDTRQTPNAVVLAHKADVLVHESTFAKNEAKMAHNYYHSTSLQAAEVAKQAGVKKLLLTHISARYTGKAAYQLAYQVRDVVPDTRVVNDFDVIDVPFKK
ncbi:MULTISPECIES: ribonuclease Z [Limosilactobacillus]|jgi:ribonuclease Z|uniref:Ribonuclease Z n=2 Tax=Limosilactobacillus vaginalis TaxID=1633 RepID=C2ES10_9LACO|nr:MULTISPECIES: ribonuclease Z [Limosilactobacillus]PEH05145.1 ribonuclease Z [Lactobacillus sp. UMNPBX5]EEJ41370.1 ribonuclease Z [Limosilactobacillus vaginalis DSM 5837 = ATCC 49540]KRM48729.1 ribonuclease Z [Limosilactobacillus vaginalis DSM 5837 = ATCC 49540]MCI6853453.1 ribonuclease Z [Limosilactobacillus vaginalis]MCZ2465472.1 ribonuclease Z [Limosilactobacillus vaginalis]